MRLVSIKLGNINTSSKLKGFVIVVSIILKFGGQEETSQQYLVNIGGI